MPSIAIALFLLSIAPQPVRATDTAPATAASAPPGTTEAPRETTATYDDWILRCAAPPGAASLAKICEADQGIQVQGRSGLIAQIAFGPLSGSNAPQLVVEVPLGSWLPKAPVLYLDQKTKTGLNTSFTVCTRACFASVAISPEVLTTLKSIEGAGRLEFINGARAPISLPVSFKGLRSALDAGLKTH